MPVEIVPFTEDCLEPAAAMVAARYRAARDRVLFLPARFEAPEVILPHLRAVAKSGPGVATVCDGRLVGFLLAFLTTPRGVRMAYVPDFGHAADPGGGRDIYRSMYASLSRAWLVHGCFSHAVTFFTHEREAIDAWFSVGFGLTTIDALRGTDHAQGPAVDVEIRRVTSEDVDLLTPLMLALRRHMAAPPVFIPLIVDEGREDLERWLSDPAHGMWVAFQGGSAVAFMRMEPSKSEVMPTSEETTVSITGAFTQEHVRGRGIGTALLNRALEWARDGGYTHCSVDFETPNIPGSRFWLGLGFQPVCYSLTRRVDGRPAWAHTGRDDEGLLRAYESRAGVG